MKYPLNIFLTGLVGAVIGTVLLFLAAIVFGTINPDGWGSFMGNSLNGLVQLFAVASGAIFGLLTGIAANVVFNSARFQNWQFVVGLPFSLRGAFAGLLGWEIVVLGFCGYMMVRWTFFSVGSSNLILQLPEMVSYLIGIIIFSTILFSIPAATIGFYTARINRNTYAYK